MYYLALYLVAMLFLELILYLEDKKYAWNAKKAPSGTYTVYACAFQGDGCSGTEGDIGIVKYTIA